MPELPEVQAIADYVDGRAAGLPIRRVDVASLAVLKTADPPYTALAGRVIDERGPGSENTWSSRHPEPTRDRST